MPLPTQALPATGLEEVTKDRCVVEIEHGALGSLQQHGLVGPKRAQMSREVSSDDP
jgi:hypothetical protein